MHGDRAIAPPAFRRRRPLRRRPTSRTPWSPPPRAPRRGRSGRDARRHGRAERSCGLETAGASRSAGRGGGGRRGSGRRAGPRREGSRPTPSSPRSRRSDSGAPTLTSPMSVSASRALSIRATTSRPPASIFTCVAPVSDASQRAAMRTPLPDISAVEPSGFQIVTAARSSARPATSRTPSDPIPSATEQSRRTRAGVSGPASGCSTTM